MDRLNPESWSPEFSDLVNDPPAGYLVRQRVLAPILSVYRDSGDLKLKLLSRVSIRGEKQEFSAPSLKCNWVLGSGMIYPLPPDVGSFLSEMLGDLTTEAVSFPRALALYRTHPEELVVELAPSVLRSANDEAKDASAIHVPGLAATPYRYQENGIAWLASSVARTGGAVLADEMGLGKTLQVIALLLLQSPTRDAPALIVCPTTLIANWVREFTRFAPSLDVVVHRGAERARLPRDLLRSLVVVTTYDTLVNDLVLFEAIEWSWLVCDEAQAIKNPDALRRVAIGRVPRLRAIPMTGTPVENHLLDLWSLVDVAIPGLLGDRQSFEAAYPDTEESARSLSLLTNAVVLKRKVRDVAADLPPRVDIVVPLELGEQLAIEYEQVRLETLERYPRAGALVATGQLQLFCAHPALIKEESDLTEAENRDFEDESRRSPHLTPKLERVIELIDESFENGRKVLLFANFNACGPIIRRARGIRPGEYWSAINGSTPPQDRQRIVDEFSAFSGPGVLVLNPRAAGAGLNITSASVVIHYTQVWNPALESQASARAHRRGQVDPVTVYHMYYVSTVEEVMLERAQLRRELGDQAVLVTLDDRRDLERALTISPVNS